MVRDKVNMNKEVNQSAPEGRKTHSNQTFISKYDGKGRKNLIEYYYVDNINHKLEIRSILNPKSVA